MKKTFSKAKSGLKMSIRCDSQAEKAKKRLAVWYVQARKYTDTFPDEPVGIGVGYTGKSPDLGYARLVSSERGSRQLTQQVAQLLGRFLEQPQAYTVALRGRFSLSTLLGLDRLVGCLSTCIHYIWLPLL
ncbi:hypothetical protein CHH67_14480 [Paenibacillus campinasensis]|uniref:Uncharacterized protein n=1 Tax=Paenibacillus campinasensis TaxID=66347 RepID=A0A268EQL3_9BACL|nr:hypothetical protein CHH67_14480 [Paenibacillus campinasensis]